MPKTLTPARATSSIRVIAEADGRSSGEGAIVAAMRACRDWGRSSSASARPSRSARHCSPSPMRPLAALILPTGTWTFALFVSALLYVV
jgi:hypothetical protein